MELATTIAPQLGNSGAAALLASHRMPLPATFSFNYFGKLFDVGIRRIPEGGAELVVRGQLGNIPYSAESVTGRKIMFDLVEAGQTLPIAEISVDRHQSIIIKGLMTFQGTPSPATVAAASAAIAIAVKPICELVVKSHDLSQQ